MVSQVVKPLKIQTLKNVQSPQPYDDSQASFQKTVAHHGEENIQPHFQYESLIETGTFKRSADH